MVEAETDDCNWPLVQSGIITDEWFGYDARGEVSDFYESTPNSGGYYHAHQTYWPNGAPMQLSGIASLPTITYSVEGEGRVNTVSASAGQNPVTATLYCPVKVDAISEREPDLEMLFTYKLQRNTLTMSRPTGQSYTAEIDGPDGIYVGDPHINSVAVKLITQNIIEETYKANGKTASTARLTLAADGKSMMVSVKNMSDATTNAFKMLKYACPN